jgi:hypothetical protein
LTTYRIDLINCIRTCFNRAILISACIIVIAPLIIGSSSALAQDAPRTNDSRVSFYNRNVKLTGTLGTYGELYNMSGAENRRPGNTGRIYFRPTLTLYNSFTVSADF